MYKGESKNKIKNLKHEKKSSRSLYISRPSRGPTGNNLLFEGGLIDHKQIAENSFFYFSFFFGFY